MLGPGPRDRGCGMRSYRSEVVFEVVFEVYGARGGPQTSETPVVIGLFEVSDLFEVFGPAGRWEKHLLYILSLSLKPQTSQTPLTNPITTGVSLAWGSSSIPYTSAYPRWPLRPV